MGCVRCRRRDRNAQLHHPGHRRERVCARSTRCRVHPGRTAELDSSLARRWAASGRAPHHQAPRARVRRLGRCALPAAELADRRVAPPRPPRTRLLQPDDGRADRARHTHSASSTGPNEASSGVACCSTSSVRSPATASPSVWTATSRSPSRCSSRRSAARTARWSPGTCCFCAPAGCGPTASSTGQHGSASRSISVARGSSSRTRWSAGSGIAAERSRREIRGTRQRETVTQPECTACSSQNWRPS